MAKTDDSQWVKLYLDHTDEVENRLSNSIKESERRTAERITELSSRVDGKVSKTTVNWLIGIATVVIGAIASKVFGFGLT